MRGGLDEFVECCFIAGRAPSISAVYTPFVASSTRTCPPGSRRATKHTRRACLSPTLAGAGTRSTCTCTEGGSTRLRGIRAVSREHQVSREQWKS